MIFFSYCPLNTNILFQSSLEKPVGATRKRSDTAIDVEAIVDTKREHKKKKSDLFDTPAPVTSTPKKRHGKSPAKKTEKKTAVKKSKKVSPAKKKSAASPRKIKPGKGTSVKKLVAKKTVAAAPTKSKATKAKKTSAKKASAPKKTTGKK